MINVPKILGLGLGGHSPSPLTSLKNSPACSTGLDKMGGKRSLHGSLDTKLLNSLRISGLECVFGSKDVCGNRAGRC